jgi:hypothetical protein
MRTIGTIFLPVFIISSVSSFAQDVTEAYNLSNTTVQGTARSMGFGNALGSVGGDFSTLSVNPAGIGIYRSSEMEFTPSLRINSATGDYAGTSTADNNTHFNFNNFGMVFTNAPKGRRYDRRKWKTFSFGFGMNRLADFNQNYTYQGVNNASSASLAFESDANNNPGNTGSVNNSLGSLGFNSYLLNQNTANGKYYTIVPFTGGVNQLKSVQTNGKIDEYAISFGGNYKEKLMLGMTIGIPTFVYDRSSYYQETIAPGNTTPNPYNFSSFNYAQNLNLSGTGINAKIGAIYKFNDIFRLGFALHTPTYYSITDRYSPGISTTHNDSVASFTVDNGALTENDFNYNFSTPWKGVLSATVMLNKIGFLTADYEYVDYSTMRYRYPGGYDYSNGESFQQEANAMNQVIKNTYKGVSNFRIGAEGKFADYFMARAGFGFYGDPYTNYAKTATPTSLLSYTTQRIDVSCGVGFHFHHFFTDLGFVHSMYQGYEQPYAIDYSGIVSGQPTTVPTAKVNYAVNNVALTMGVKF